MSDYEAVETLDDQSELGNFEAENESSGYDALTTSEAGKRQDAFLEDSGYISNLQNDADKQKKRKSEHHEKLNDALCHAFEQAHQHIDNHKYNIKVGDQDYEISHGDLKNFMKKQAEGFDKKIAQEKSAKKREQMQDDQRLLRRLARHMETEGMLSQAQIDEFNEVLERHPELKDDLKKEAALENKVATDNQKSLVSAANDTQTPQEPQLVDEYEGQELKDIMQAASNPQVSMSGDLDGNSQQAEPMEVKQVASLPMDMNVTF